MKVTKIILTTALIGAFSLTMAASTDNQSQMSNGVDMQIEKIQTASASERVALMNEFKQRVMQMNEADREAALQEMQAKMHTEAKGHFENAEQHAQDMQMKHAQKGREHAQDMQMKHTQGMTNMQNMGHNLMENHMMQAGGAAGQQRGGNRQQRGGNGQH